MKVGSATEGFIASPAQPDRLAGRHARTHARTHLTCTLDWRWFGSIPTYVGLILGATGNWRGLLVLMIICWNFDTDYILSNTGILPGVLKNIGIL